MAPRLPLLLPLLLLATLVPSASADDPFYLEYDVKDVVGDVADARDSAVLFPDRAEIDILRLTAFRDGDAIVQTVHVAGRLPADFVIDFADATSESERAGTLSVTWASGQETKAAGGAYAATLAFDVARTSTTVTVRFLASGLPEGATCFVPRVTLTWMPGALANAPSVQDRVKVSPNICYGGSLTDGLDGTCPHVSPTTAYDVDAADAEGDVIATLKDGGVSPADLPEIDIVGFSSALVGNRIEQTVTFVEPGAAAAFAPLLHTKTETAGRAHVADVAPGVSITYGGGSVINGALFHIDVVSEGPRVMTSFCASVLPAGTGCYNPSVVAAAGDRQRYELREYSDRFALSPDPCAAKAAAVATPVNAVAATAAAASEPPAGAPKDAPGAGVLLTLLVGAVAALTLARRSRK